MSDFWDEKIEIGGESAFTTSLLTGRNIDEVRAEKELRSRMANMASTFAQSSSVTESMLAHLTQQNLELSKSVAKLHAMVGTFAQALARSGAIHEADWRWSLEELQRAFAAIDPPPATPARPAAPTQGGSPYRDGRAERPATSSAKAPKPAPVLIACVTCSEQVDVATTQMTEHGAQCEPCFRKDELARLERGES